MNHPSLDTRLIRAAGFFLLIYLCADVGIVLLTWVVIHRNLFLIWSFSRTEPNAVQIRFMLKRAVLYATCAIYGIGRIKSRHPAFHHGYANWLRTTPWNRGLPLPLGAIHLRWPDFICLAGLAALAKFDLNLNPAWPLIIFGVPYLFFARIAFRSTAPGAGVALLFGLGAIVLSFPDPDWMLAIVAIMYAIFYAGLMHSLNDSPSKVEQLAIEAAKQRNMTLAKPFNVLLAGSSIPVLSIQRVFITALQAGWWTYCIGRQCERVNGPSMFIAYTASILAGCIFAFGRWIIYRGNHSPPITLRGRFANGRFIIPGYDYMYLAPLATICAPLIVLAASYNTQASPSLVAAMSVFAALLVAMAAGPSRRHWDLTGEHSLVSAVHSRGRPAL